MAPPRKKGVKIVDSVLERIRTKDYVTTGTLFGLEIDGEIWIVTAALNLEDPESVKEASLMNEILPCGIEPVGVFGRTKEADSTDLIKKLVALLPSNAQEDDSSPSEELVPPAMIVLSPEKEDTYIFDNNKLHVVTLSTVTQEDLNQQTVLARVRGKIDLACGFSAVEMGIAIKHLIEKVSSPYGTFVMEGNQVIYLHKFITEKPRKGWSFEDSREPKPGFLDEEEVIIVGLPGFADKYVVEDLWQYSAPKEEDDGFGGDQLRVKGKVAKRDRLEFELVWNYTNPGCTSKTPNCAPIVYYEVSEAQTVCVPIVVDALAINWRRLPAKEFLQNLKGAVARQLSDIGASLLSEFTQKQKVSLPEVFHYRPRELPHFMSIVYPKNSTDEKYLNFRRTLQESFMLPLDRPVFRRTNAYTFPVPGQKGKLSNVHEGILEKHGVNGAQVATVWGNYTYYHYMQDKFDDDGWGCAYRSLQTIFSWLRRQGYTAAEVPTHEQIQKCLVDIGDKDYKFIGSKQWIGSTEVGFVLETLGGIQSRFLSVSAGSELHTKVEELYKHFKTVGTPVMVGGGVYAHTIIGVAFDEAAEKYSWLILDPHYTGSDDLKTIISKGWCGWKTAKFWNQTAFYNMCLPQVPSNLI